MINRHQTLYPGDKVWTLRSERKVRPCPECGRGEYTGKMFWWVAEADVLTTTITAKHTGYCLSPGGWSVDKRDMFTSKKKAEAEAKRREAKDDT